MRALLALSMRSDGAAAVLVDPTLLLASARSQPAQQSGAEELSGQRSTRYREGAATQAARAAVDAVAAQVAALSSALDLPRGAIIGLLRLVRTQAAAKCPLRYKRQGSQPMTLCCAQPIHTWLSREA